MMIMMTTTSSTKTAMTTPMIIASRLLMPPESPLTVSIATGASSHHTIQPTDNTLVVASIRNKI